MPRVKRFEELPAWLQVRIAADWTTLCPVPIPPIRDPEYRVHRLGDSGWWVVDAGTGGITVEREGESHAYAELDPSSELFALVAAEAKLDRETDHIEKLTNVILGQGVSPLALGRYIVHLKEDGCTNADIVRDLVGLLCEGLDSGEWLIG